MAWMRDAASDRNTCERSHRSDGVMLSSLFAGIARAVLLEKKAKRRTVARPREE